MRKLSNSSDRKYTTNSYSNSLCDPNSPSKSYNDINVSPMTKGNIKTKWLF